MSLLNKYGSVRVSLGYQQYVKKRSAGRGRAPGRARAPGGRAAILCLEPTNNNCDETVGQKWARGDD
eukprot:7903992-Pyramimonas_sp.AAC.1